jgi:hypothetical protein
MEKTTSTQEKTQTQQINPRSLKPYQHNKLSPHQTVITINCQTMEKLPSGQVNGIPVNKVIKIYSVQGKDYETCLKNLEKWLKNLKQ